MANTYDCGKIPNKNFGFKTHLRESAIFSPTSVQTGVVSPILAKSALTARTRPPDDKLPMLTMRTSFLVSLATLAPFLSPEIVHFHPKQFYTCASLFIQQYIKYPGRSACMLYSRVPIFGSTSMQQSPQLSFLDQKFNISSISIKTEAPSSL